MILRCFTIICPDLQLLRWPEHLTDLSCRHDAACGRRASRAAKTEIPLFLFCASGGDAFTLRACARTFGTSQYD